MITESTLYWITRLDKIINVVDVVTTIFGCATIFISTIYLYYKSDSDNLFEQSPGFRTPFILSVAIFALGALTLAFIPSTKEMCAIKVIPAIANNPKVEAIPDKILDLANKYMDEKLNIRKVTDNAEK